MAEKPPKIVVRGAPFRARVLVYPFPEHSRRRWRVEARLRVRCVESGKRGDVVFFCTIERPPGKSGPPPRKVLVSAAREQLRRALLHELDERLFVDGKRPFDPHARRRRRG